MAENGLNEKQASKVKLYTVALIYTFSIGFSFLAIKKCVPYADSLTILAYRYDFALLGVIVWFSVCRLLGKQQKQPKDTDKLKAADKPDPVDKPKAARKRRPRTQVIHYD